MFHEKHWEPEDNAVTMMEKKKKPKRLLTPNSIFSETILQRHKLNKLFSTNKNKGFVTSRPTQCLRNSFKLKR